MGLWLSSRQKDAIVRQLGSFKGRGCHFLLFPRQLFFLRVASRVNWTYSTTALATNICTSARGSSGYLRADMQQPRWCCNVAVWGLRNWNVIVKRFALMRGVTLPITSGMHQRCSAFFLFLNLRTPSVKDTNNAWSMVCFHTCSPLPCGTIDCISVQSSRFFLLCKACY